MKSLLLAALSLLLFACQAPRAQAPQSSAEPAPTARPEIRYYMIADT